MKIMQIKDIPKRKFKTESILNDPKEIIHAKLAFNDLLHMANFNTTKL